jgi:hypothetical protein
MSKEQIMQLVTESEADANLKEMLLSYIKLSYDQGYSFGYADGCKAATSIQTQLFNSLLFNNKKV